MLETWLPVIGYEGYYEVSSFGRVKRIAPAKGATVGAFLKPSYDEQGYACIVLSKKCKTRPRRVHKIVTEEFIGPSNGRPVNHKDLDKGNNSVLNLEYTTPKENIAHAISKGALVRSKNNGRFIKAYNS